jgi:SAM-dependent methyltransferase
MNHYSPPDRATIRPPHPLARHLIERLHGRPGSRILDFCAGSGRNGAALRAAGHDVVAIDDSAAESADPLPAALGQFVAVICTHGLLHGSVSAISTRLASIAERLNDDGLLYAAFGSVRDARFGRGRRLGPATFAPLDGDEQGVAHTYFTRTTLAASLKPLFVVERRQEWGVDAVAGEWAHRRQPLSKAFHWFVVARRASIRSSSGLDALA